MTESPPRDLNTYHLFTPPTSLKAWEQRARELREQILFSAGLWPMPEKTPLAPRITGRVEGPDYIIENVALRTLPGFYLAGNLYRPKGRQPPYPAVVNPHGHWKSGRLEMEPDLPRAEPPPAPPAPGRGNLVAIGVNLARMGFVTFAYDMVGYNDTSTVSHTFAGDLRAWLHGVSLMGLQLWNSIRVVDFLQSLPDVDPARIGATGASGGGTQTFLLCSVDDRIRVAVPVNMISARMQGGCLCENGPGLRLGTDNVEIAALMAPKPLLIVSCTGDWTRENPTQEWPAIRQVYDLYGAGDRTAVVQFNYGHNYNIESRQAMYAWFGRWLLNDPEPAHFRERPFDLDPETLRVFSNAHPMPEDALSEPELIQSLIAAGERQLAARWPTSAAELASFRKEMATALRNALGVEAPRAPASAAASPAGSRALIVLLDDEQDAGRRLQTALDGRYGSVSCLKLPKVSLPAEALWQNFFSGYNRTPLGDSVQAIVERLVDLGTSDRSEPDLIGMGGAGLLALVARALVPGAGRTVIDVGRFDTRDDVAYLPALYAPGLRRAGDFRTAAALVAPAPLCLHNTGDAFPTNAIAAAFRAAGARLRVERKRLSEHEIAAWLS